MKEWGIQTKLKFMSAIFLTRWQKRNSEMSLKNMLPSYMVCLSLYVLKQWCAPCSTSWSTSSECERYFSGFNASHNRWFSILGLFFGGKFFRIDFTRTGARVFANNSRLCGIPVAIFVWYIKIFVRVIKRSHVSVLDLEEKGLGSNYPLICKISSLLIYERN